MRILPLSDEFAQIEPPEPPMADGRWFTRPSVWAVISILSFGVLAVIPVAMPPKPQWAGLYEPRLPCEVIDWRIGEKLAVLEEREDRRSQVMVSRSKGQREAARQHCRAGRVDDAMIAYGVLDKALTRYVQFGSAPTLPK